MTTHGHNSDGHHNAGAVHSFYAHAYDDSQNNIDAAACNDDDRVRSAHASGHIISAEWLLNAASARLAANKGARCPLRVAMAALGADIEERLVSTTDLRGAALCAARQAAVQLARSTPEVMCTLVMCDLCVSWSRALLASVKPRAAAAAASNGKQLDFHALTASFAEASVIQKKADDPSTLYSVRVCDATGSDKAFGNNDDDGDDKSTDHVEGGGVDYCFANEATYVSYRYFMRRAWEGLGGVPSSWARPMPRDVCGWIESAVRMRDLCLTLPQHRLCLPPRRDAQRRDSPETYTPYRREGGRGGRLPSGDAAGRMHRSGTSTQSTSERTGWRTLANAATTPTNERDGHQTDPNAVHAFGQDASRPRRVSGTPPWAPQKSAP
ncbi:hypothetical protein pkur_cds_183 [Pandoravirus kuranda]|uniref:Uncharacterized protein n=1 Tax=Pandoravirus kuranda TaxID=3019033 RepID=A0AA95EGB9_9VIRU|nr:hypothetical protein pkur_cds_183 [Pandoravirus kuranda]